MAEAQTSRNRTATKQPQKEPQQQDDRAEGPRGAEAERANRREGVARATAGGGGGGGDRGDDRDGAAIAGETGAASKGRPRSNSKS